MITRRDVFQAIADPTRRAIIHKLAGQTCTLTQVASEFDISQPAISKHIKILNECGLLIIKKNGRERFCTANLKALREVAEWADQYKVFWTGRLDKLEQLLKKEANVLPNQHNYGTETTLRRSPAADKKTRR